MPLAYASKSADLQGRCPHRARAPAHSRHCARSLPPCGCDSQRYQKVHCRRASEQARSDNTRHEPAVGAPAAVPYGEPVALLVLTEAELHATQVGHGVRVMGSRADAKAPSSAPLRTRQDRPLSTDPTVTPKGAHWAAARTRTRPARRRCARAWRHARARPPPRRRARAWGCCRWRCRRRARRLGTRARGPCSPSCPAPTRAPRPRTTRRPGSTADRCLRTPWHFSMRMT